MATVPREFGPQVQAQPLQPQYQSARGADASAFGTALDARAFQQTAQAVEQMGNSLMEAQRKIQERNDVVARAREFGSFGEFATTTLTALQDTGDIADPRTVATYRQQLDEKIGEMVSNHAGSDNSRAVLQARLYEQRSALLDQAAVTSAAAGKKAVSDQLGTELNTEAAAVGADPTQFTSAMARWNSKLDDFADALTPEEERTFRKAGPAAFVGAAIDNILMQPNGDQEAMKLLQTSPGLMSFLSPPEQQALQQRIRVVAGANAAERNKTYSLSPGAKLVDGSGKVIARGDPVAQPKSKSAEALEMMQLFSTVTGQAPSVEQVSQITGMGSATQSAKQKADDFQNEFTTRLKRDPTPQEWQKYFGVDRPDGAQTLTDKVAEIKTILGAEGKVLTDDQLNVVLGIHKDPSLTLSQKVKQAEDAIGRELKDREVALLGSFYAAPEKPEPGPDLESDSGTVFANLAERYANGDTTPLEDRQFEFAVQNYIQPTTFQNPDTGLTEERRNELPSYVKKAVIARGKIELPDDVATDAPAGAGGQVPQGIQEQGAQQPTGAQPQPSTADAGPPTKENAVAQREPTIYEMAPDVTGPEAATKQMVSRNPLLPGNFPKETMAKSYVDTELRNLTTALQNSPQFAQGERKAIEEELDLKGSFFDDPKDYQDRIVGIDKALEKRYEEALRRAADPKTSKQLRQQSLDVVQLIGDFRKKLMPERFDTRADLDEWLAAGNSGPVLVKTGDGYTLISNPKPKAKVPTDGR